MRTTLWGFCARPVAVATSTLAFMCLLTSPSGAGVKVFEKEDFKLELGLRLQPRMEIEHLSRPGGDHEWLRDFLVRRTRWKAGGEIREVEFNFEWKIDGTDQYNSTPSASVENAYIELPLYGELRLRAGLYDQPFSRDRLTSDSKQLAVDRGNVSNAPNALGLADNATGFDLRGSVRGHRVQYAVGMFDNRTISTPLQNSPMVVGRVDVNLGATKDVLRDAHFGKDSWYSFGVNGGYQGKLEDTNAATEDNGSNAVGGIDGMVDVPAGSLRLFARSEVNVIKQKPVGGGNALDTTAWMLGCGVSLFQQRLQPIVRFDEVRYDDAAGGGVKDVTYVGLNLYKKEHGSKIQGDVRFESGTHESVDGVRLQAQVDF